MKAQHVYLQATQRCSSLFPPRFGSLFICMSPPTTACLIQTNNQSPPPSPSSFGLIFCTPSGVRRLHQPKSPKPPPSTRQPVGQNIMMMMCTSFVRRSLLHWSPSSRLILPASLSREVSSSSSTWCPPPWSASSTTVAARSSSLSTVVGSLFMAPLPFTTGGTGEQRTLLLSIIPIYPDPGRTSSFGAEGASL